MSGLLDQLEQNAVIKKDDIAGECSAIISADEFNYIIGKYGEEKNDV